MKKLVSRKLVLKEAGVLLIAVTMVLTSLATVTTATTVDSSTVLLDEKVTKTTATIQTVLLDEDFTPWGVFPPAGWTTDSWSQSNTNEAGGAAPEARVYKWDQYYLGYYYDNYIMTPPVDASACNKVILEFKFAADVYYANLTNFYVQYRDDAASPWVDVTPWSNPLPGNFVGTYMVTITCGTGGCGTALQVKWEYKGYYYYYNYFYLDDVKIYCCDPDNLPPTPPSIVGPPSGKAGNPYTYTFTSTDPDGPLVSYYIDWGDTNITPWTTFQPSGSGYAESHTWIAQGTYIIQAKAKDICGAESAWSSLKVTMPRNRAINTPFLRLLQNNPYLFSILRQLLGL